jgi:hypothetical protein
LNHPLSQADFLSDLENGVITHVYYIENDRHFAVEETISNSDGSNSINFYVFDSLNGEYITPEQRMVSHSTRVYRYKLDSDFMVEAKVSVDKDTGGEFLEYIVKDSLDDTRGRFWLPGHYFDFCFETSSKLVQQTALDLLQIKQQELESTNAFYERYFASSFEDKRKILTSCFRRYNRSCGEGGCGELYAFLNQEMYDNLKVDEDFLPALKEIAANDIDREDEQSTEQVFKAMFYNVVM